MWSSMVMDAFGIRFSANDHQSAYLPADTVNEILLRVLDLFREEWVARIRKVNDQYKSIWETCEESTIVYRGELLRTPLQFVILVGHFPNDKEYESGRSVNYRLLPVAEHEGMQYSASICNFKIGQTTRCRVPEHY